MRSVTAVIAWRESRLVGTALLQGRSGEADRLSVDLVLPGGTSLRIARVRVNRGAFTRIVALPSSLTPGRYALRIRSAAGTRSVSTFRLALPAPPEGIARPGGISARRGGPAAARIAVGASELYATVALRARPVAGRRITLTWYGPDGALVGQPVAKPAGARVEGFLKLLNAPAGLPAGRWQCVVRAGGTVIARLRTTVG